MRLLALTLIVAGIAIIARALPPVFGGTWLGWAITVPGIFMHELAHYVFALVLGANPTNFSILPSFEDGAMISYGHVIISPSWWNAATIALAPLLLAPASVWIMLIIPRLPTLLKPIAVWVAIAGFYSMAPSAADLQIVLKEPASILFAVVILGFFFELWIKLIRIEEHFRSACSVPRPDHLRLSARLRHWRAGNHGRIAAHLVACVSGSDVRCAVLHQRES